MEKEQLTTLGWEKVESYPRRRLRLNVTKYQEVCLARKTGRGQGVLGSGKAQKQPLLGTSRVCVSRRAEDRW